MQRRQSTLRILCALAIILVPLCLFSQDNSPQTERQRAFALYNQQKNLEALPLFEDLAQKSPEDGDVLAALGGCLVTKSATIEDEQEATKTRLRARQLLLKAQSLGHNTALTKNLLQMLPEDGAVHYKNTPSDIAMKKAEAAFSRGDFDEAIKDYQNILEIDPTNYGATLYIGDSYFAAKNFAKAAEWYQKAIDLDPNVETAYRYYADMLTKNGDLEHARTKAIQAVVADPYNAVPWRGLQQWAEASHVKLTSVHIKVQNAVTKNDDQSTTITIDPNQPTKVGAVWLTYSLVKARWQEEDFKKNFPTEKAYRHSLAEEAEALNTTAKVLEELTAKEKSAALERDQNLALLLKLYKAGFIEAYVLLSAPDKEIVRDYDDYRTKNRPKLEQYLSQFVVPPVAAH